MTSGNRGGEPIHIDGREFIEALPTGLPDLVLDHDREILTPLDDSIYQLVRIGEREEVQILRRARGLVPEPIWIDRRVEEDTFAAGGDLKNSFALAREDAVYLSGHFGDLEWIPCRKAREKSIKNMTRLLGIKPQKSICDLHPAYFSSNDLRKEAEEAAKTDSKQKKLLEVQHHLAHIMSVIAEEKESPKITDVDRDGDETIHLKFHIRDDERKVILGLAFDGTGYGTDGRVWGSEFLRVMIEGDTIVYKNLFHLHPVLQLGGDEGASKVVGVRREEGIASVDFSGNKVEARMGFVDVVEGDYVLVHAGCILQKISEDEADMMTDLFTELEGNA